MIAVSNTTPLRYLIAIEQELLLGQLFEKVIVPVAVHEELTEAKTPEKVRRRVLSLPAWYEVRKAPETQVTAFRFTLHRGEREAILLAETLRPDVILIDEQVGRTIALNRNLPVSGTWELWSGPTRLGSLPISPKFSSSSRQAASLWPNRWSSKSYNAIVRAVEADERN